MSRRPVVTAALVSVAALVLAACSSTPSTSTATAASGPGRDATPGTTTGTAPGTTGTTSTTTAATTSTPGTGVSSSAIDPTAVPLGDGHRGSTAQVGWVMSCQTQFGAGAGGAFTDGPWIDTAAGTWDRTAKVAVDDGTSPGVSSFSITVEGSERVVRSNGLPDHVVGAFPVQSDDDAYRYDRNPNTVRAGQLTYRLPAAPQVADAPTCLPMGPIGVMLSGVVFFNALDGPGRDAAAHEVQDACGGHPERTGQYHYHDLPSCLDVSAEADGHSGLVGWAFDGFGLYGPNGEGGVALTNADLDECHGHTHEVGGDGARTATYHYHATTEYPYTLGCYRGTSTVAAPAVGGPGAGGGPPARPPA